MATPAKFPSEIATRIYDLLDASKVDLYGADAMLFYGDQARVPVTPSICIEAGTTDRTLSGAQGPHGRVTNEHECFIIIYWARVMPQEEEKLNAEQCGEATAQFLDGNPQLVLNADGGIVIHGFVTTIDPGYTYRNKGQLFHAVRLTWRGKTKTMLGA